MSVNQTLIVTPGPHISKPMSTRSVMLDVIIGLCPAIFAAIYYFRLHAALLISACIFGCVVTEWAFCILRKKNQTINDLSAVLTGIILAMSLPPKMPVSYAIIGSVFTISIAKMVFGGLGCNTFNPAMAGRVFLTACFGAAMTTWTVPAVLNSGMPQITAKGAEVTSFAGQSEQELQAITQATPLGWVKESIKNAYKEIGKTGSISETSKTAKAEWEKSQLKSVLFGYTGGCLGETSAVALILGGIYILLRRTIEFIVPLTCLLSAFIFAEIIHLVNPDIFVNPLFHILGGGMLMCAFFIATDPVTIPITRKGMAIYGTGVGLLIMLIRTYGGYPEGVMYAVLVMNSVTPLIDRFCKRVPVGGVTNG